MKKSIVLFDIDRTLFDTEKFTDQLLEGVVDFEKSLHSEVFEALEMISKKATLGIFSKGQEKFQRAKIKTIQHFFDQQHIHIHIDKGSLIPSILEKYKEVELYVLDDSLEILSKIKKYNKNILTVWVRRGPYAKSIKGHNFKPDIEIENLKELINKL